MGPAAAIIQGYCLGAGLSDIGGGAAFLAAARGGLLFLVAEAGAELVGGALSGAAVCDCDGGALGGGSAVMMLTGGIDCDDGNCTFGPGGVIGPLEPLAPLEASGRVRVGQLTE